MIVGRFLKTPFEEITRSVDFTRLVPAGATVNSFSVTGTTESGAPASIIATNPPPTRLGYLVLFQAMGGSTGQWYAISTKITLSDGQAFEALVIMGVQ